MRLHLRLARVVASATAALLLVGACGSSDDDQSSSPTTRSTTTTAASTTTAAPATCGLFGAVGETSGPAAITRTPAIALLGNVQVQASGCVDEVAFLFFGGIPSWTVGYRDGPFTADPSDLPVPVAGAAFLHVAMQQASGVDMAQDKPVQIYDGPESVKRAAPSDVAEVRRLGDFEAVNTWVVGLPERRPYEVIVRGEQLVIRLAAPKPRTTACRLEAAGVTIGYPAAWFAELSDRWTCQYLDPAPFVVHPGTNDLRWAVTLQAADRDAAGVLARMTDGSSQISRSTTKVAGFDATVLDIVENGQGMRPAGYGFRMYVVDTGAHALTITGAAAPPGPQIAASQKNADLIASLVRR